MSSVGGSELFRQLMEGAMANVEGTTPGRAQRGSRYVASPAQSPHIGMEDDVEAEAAALLRGWAGLGDADATSPVRPISAPSSRSPVVRGALDRQNDVSNGSGSSDDDDDSDDSQPRMSRWQRLKEKRRLGLREELTSSSESEEASPGKQSGRIAWAANPKVNSPAGSSNARGRTPAVADRLHQRQTVASTHRYAPPTSNKDERDPFQVRLPSKKDPTIAMQARQEMIKERREKAKEMSKKQSQQKKKRTETDKLRRDVLREERLIIASRQREEKERQKRMELTAQLMELQLELQQEEQKNLAARRQRELRRREREQADSLREQEERALAAERELYEEEEEMLRIRTADAFYRQLQIRRSRRAVMRSFQTWRGRVRETRAREVAVDHWRERSMLTRFFSRWMSFVENLRFEKAAATYLNAMQVREEAIAAAAQLHRRHALSRHLRAWRRYVRRSVDSRQRRELKAQREELAAQLLRNAQLVSQRDRQPRAEQPVSTRHARGGDREASPPERPARRYARGSPSARVSRRAPSESPTKTQTKQTAMEMRALERKARRDQLQRKYEEKEAKRRAAELEERARAEREKKEERERRREERLQAKREAQRVEEERQQRIDEMRRLNAVAHSFADRAALYYRGFLPWKKLVIHRRKQAHVAARFRVESLVVNAFSSWRDSVHMKQNNRLARRFHHTSVISRAFSAWCGFVLDHRLIRERYEHAQHLTAIGYHRLSMQRGAFRVWKQLIVLRRRFNAVAKDQARRSCMRIAWLEWRRQFVVRTEAKRQVAVQAEERRCVRRALRAWKEYMQLCAREREEQKYLNNMWSKVHTWLEGHNPP